TAQQWWGQVIMEFQVEHVIHAAPAEVARIMFDPALETQWISNASMVELLPPGPIAVGSRVRREGGFLGKSFSWVSEVTAFEPDHLLEMNIVEGPMQGVLTFEVSSTAGGSIAMIHTRNQPSLRLPGAGWVLKREVGEDLGRLAKLVTSRNHAG